MLDIIEVADETRKIAHQFKEGYLDPIRGIIEDCESDEARIVVLEYQSSEYEEKLYTLKFFHNGQLVGFTDDLWWECKRLSSFEYIRTNALNGSFIWNYNFQEDYITNWANGWALNFMIEWVSQQINDICNRRFNEREPASIGLLHGDKTNLPACDIPIDSSIKNEDVESKKKINHHLNYLLKRI